MPSCPSLSDEAIHDLLRTRLDISKRAVGGVIGIVDDTGVRTISGGQRAHDDPRPVAADTLCEIGCVTKVLTGLLCAEMIERGEIGLSDPIADYLPPQVATRGRNGVAMRVEHLITHTSGLPHQSVDVLDPIARVHDFVSTHVPRHDVGAYYQYSTIGFALLGDVLARRAGVPHHCLVQDRVCAPLGMTDTVVDVPSASAHRIAIGHDAGLVAVRPRGTPSVTGGYGFHSTATDLLRLVAACTGRVSTPLDAALARTTAFRRPGAPGMEQVAMAWHISSLEGQDLISHNGHSLGHRVFVGYMPQTRHGVVALLNGVAPIGVTDICRHLLNPRCPVLPADSVLLRPPRRPPSETMPVGPDRAAHYIGVYQLTPTVRVTATCDADGVWLTSGSERQRIVPCGEHEFWLPAVGFRSDSLLRFEGADAGPATAMVVSDRGWERRLIRVDVAPVPPIWHGRRANGLAPASLPQYAGRYQFDGYVLEVRCVEQALWAAWVWAGRAPAAPLQVLATGGTGRPRELLHEHGHAFFFNCEELDAALVFESGAGAQIVAVTCRMGERHERGVRLPSMLA